MAKRTFICHFCKKSFDALVYKSRTRKFCGQKCAALNRRMFSEEQCKEIVSVYLNGRSITSIGRMFGVSHVVIREVLNREKIKFRGKQRYRKFTLNENKFDEIDDEETAYWLGFIYADGYVRQDGLTVRLKEDDKSHLEKLQAWMSSDAKILGHNSDFGNTMKITFHSYHMARRLRELGIVPYRPYFHRCLRAMPHNLIVHFARGLIDGDGYITRKGSNTPNVGFCGQLDAVKWMKKTLIEKCNLKGNPKIRLRRGTSYEVAFGGIFQVKKILNVIYKDIDVCLNRKKVLADYWIAKRTSRNDY